MFVLLDCAREITLGSASATERSQGTEVIRKCGQCVAIVPLGSRIIASGECCFAQLPVAPGDRLSGWNQGDFCLSQSDRIPALCCRSVTPKHRDMGQARFRRHASAVEFFDLAVSPRSLLVIAKLKQGISQNLITVSISRLIFR